MLGTHRGAGDPCRGLAKGWLALVEAEESAVADVRRRGNPAATGSPMDCERTARGGLGAIRHVGEGGEGVERVRLMDPRMPVAPVQGCESSGGNPLEENRRVPGSSALREGTMVRFATFAAGRIAGDRQHVARDFVEACENTRFRRARSIS